MVMEASSKLFDKAITVGFLTACRVGAGEEMV